MLYAEDFDTAPIAPESQPTVPPPAPTFDSTEVAEACAAAAQDAVRAARLLWDSEAAGLRAKSLDRIAAALAASHDGAQSLAEEVGTEVVRTILAVLASLLPHLCRLHGDAEVRALLGHLLPQLGAEPKVTIRVHPAVLDALQEDFRALDPDLSAAVTVSALATLGRGDARVAWRSGSLARDAGAIAAALRAGLADLGLLNAYPTASDAVHTAPEQRMTHAH